MVSPLKIFRDYNVKISNYLTPSSLWQTRGFAMYDWIARALLAEDRVQTVCDIGGGRTWYFGRSTNRNIKIIGVDVSADELDHNSWLDQKIVADVCSDIPLDDHSLDLVLCRATVEHLSNVESFLEILSRKVRPGGKVVLVFANKYAPPMMINRLIPNKLAEFLLILLVPGTKGYGGFRAFYDKCTVKEFKRSAVKCGFKVNYEYCSYYSSSYFQFFVPLFILSIALDCIRAAFSIKLLSSMNLFILESPEDFDKKR